MGLTLKSLYDDVWGEPISTKSIYTSYEGFFDVCMAITGLNRIKLCVQIEEVKKEIETAETQFPKDVTNVIYQGKILKDGESLKDSGVTEQGFCVVMAMKVCVVH